MKKISFFFSDWLLNAVGSFGSEWHTVDEQIVSAYRAFSSEKIVADLGIHIGFNHVNVTLRSKSQQSIYLDLFTLFKSVLLFLFLFLFLCLFSFPRVLGLAFQPSVSITSNLSFYINIATSFLCLFLSFFHSFFLSRLIIHIDFDFSGL